ncbi:hypothetical protein GCWU000321_00476 [Dialister invisus DSM 15470]|uniref:Uncharacterized protein n=1 Tax=Dialister invisus DSM 15470 TaxID=592028 RepID=C9LLU5_9FIRM|nr:hypothetical protein GCWU000321_00476 [Dialister invisus DSM 15470]
MVKSTECIIISFTEDGNGRRRRGLYEYLLTYMQNIDRICTLIILFEIWRWEYVQ